MRATEDGPARRDGSRRATGWWKRLFAKLQRRERRAVALAALLAAALVTVALLLLRDALAPAPPPRRPPPAPAAPEAASARAARRCELPPWPALLGERGLAERLVDARACEALVEARLTLLEAYVAARDGGCAVPRYPARAHHHLIEAVRCLNVLPVGDSYDAAYRRIVVLVPRIVTEGPTRCLRLALLRGLRLIVPDAVPRALAAMRGPVPIGRCGAGEQGAFDVPQGFSSWVSAGVRRGPAIAAVSATGPQREIPVRGADGGMRRTSGQLTVPATINGSPLSITIDTGAGSFVAIDPATAARLGIAAYQTGDWASGCMTCPLRPMRIGWIDTLEIGPYRLRNVPADVLVQEHETRLAGMALVGRLGGMTIGGGPGGQLAVVLGPHTACGEPIPSVLGAQGRVFVRADLGPLGQQQLMLDTSLGTDFALFSTVVGQVPASWQQEDQSEHQALYHVPAMAGLGRAGTATRHVQLYQPGGPHPRFAGSEGWVGHAAFAPYPLCIRPAQPMLASGR